MARTSRAAAPARHSSNFRQDSVAGDLHMVEIVEAGAAEVPVRNVEPRRLDDFDGKAEAGGHAQHRAGVLRDVGLVKSKADHVASSAATGLALVRPCPMFAGNDGKRTMLKRFNTWLESRIDVFAPFDDARNPAGVAGPLRRLLPQGGAGLARLVVFLSALLLAGIEASLLILVGLVRRPPQQDERRTSFCPTYGSLLLAGPSRSSWCGR